MSARKYIRNGKYFIDCTALIVLMFHSKHRLLVNERPYTNFLHGTVPAYWCFHPNYPNKCDLGGVNSLCLPNDCPEKSWCSLNKDCSVLNGHWSEWSDECSMIGGDGIRSRTCNRPAPRNGGKPCFGNTKKACAGTNKRSSVIAHALRHPLPHLSVRYPPFEQPDSFLES